MRVCNNSTVWNFKSQPAPAINCLLLSPTDRRRLNIITISMFVRIAKILAIHAFPPQRLIASRFITLWKLQPRFHLPLPGFTSPSSVSPLPPRFHLPQPRFTRIVVDNKYIISCCFTIAKHLPFIHTQRYIRHFHLHATVDRLICHPF